MAALITDGQTTPIRVDILHTSEPGSDRMALLDSVRTDAPVETPGLLFDTNRYRPGNRVSTLIDLTTDSPKLAR